MIAIIDYRAGNLKSVERALRKLGFPCAITQDREEILSAERIVFPGVGATGKAIADLRRLGLDKVLVQAFEAHRPILGICLGAQIVLDRSEENHTQCLGLIPGEARHFPSPLSSEQEGHLKIPHMGWNGVHLIRQHPVLKDVQSKDEFYFVHSYYPVPSSDSYVIGTTQYGIEFPSIIGRNSLLAMQFHPEKSGAPGLKILENFCQWDGRYAE